MINIFRTLLILFFSTIYLNLPAQIASYPFDNNLDDAIGGFNANSNGTANFEDGHLSVGGDGIVTLPSNLSSNIFSQGSIQINFDFRIDDSNEYALLFSGSTNGASSAPWEENGFRVLIDQSAIVINYSNADGTGNYEWTGVHDIERNKWYSLSIVFDLDRSLHNIILDGVGAPEDLQGFLNLDTFRAGVENNLMTIGGFNGQNRGNYQGTFDIDNLAIFVPAPSSDDAVIEIYEELSKVLSGQLTLSDQEIREKMKFVETNFEFLKYEVVKDAMLAYAQLYESLNEPLYQDGTTYSREELPPLGRALQVAQNFILQKGFVPSNVENMAGLIYEHHEVFPGKVPNDAERVTTASIEVNGSYLVDPAAELTDQSRVVRPTGYYVVAGDIATIKVPSSVIDKGLSIIVGAHFRNMDYDYIGAINRFPNISAEYPLDAEEIKIANPFGGGIYLKVPEGAEAGWFDMTIENAIQAPYFSYREGRKTDVNQWLEQVANTDAPWADFESDKFMFTITIQEVQGVTNPDKIMERWDEIMDAIRTAAGRPFKRPRAEYYSFDTRLVTPAYGAGYPLVIPFWEMRGQANWNPLKVMNTRPNAILLHEMGHNHLHPTLDFGEGYNSCGFIEAETIVHTLALSVYNNVYGMDINTSFAESFVPNGFDFNEACFDWIITDNFRKGLPMIYDESAPMDDKEMLKYQPRGWAKYGDIVRLFGWAEGLGKVNGAFYQEGEQAIGNACPDRPFIVGRDEYIRAACISLEENISPLFHFWGIHPSKEIQTAMESYPKSQRVKALIERYRCEVAPNSKDDYLAYHNQMYDRMDYQKSRFDVYIQEFNETYIADIQAQFDFILNEYGLIGPNAPSNLTGTTQGDQVTLNWEDNAQSESGYIITYRLTSEENFNELATLGPNISSFSANMSNAGEYEFNVVAINSEDLESDACATPSLILTVEEGTTSILEGLAVSGINLYPNPTKDRLILENKLGVDLKRFAIFDLNGQKKFDYELNGIVREANIELPLLPQGIYLVRLSSGKKIYSLKLVIEN